MIREPGLFRLPKFRRRVQTLRVAVRFGVSWPAAIEAHVRGDGGPPVNPTFGRSRSTMAKANVRSTAQCLMVFVAGLLLAGCEKQDTMSTSHQGLPAADAGRPADRVADAATTAEPTDGDARQGRSQPAAKMDQFTESAPGNPTGDSAADSVADPRGDAAMVVQPAETGIGPAIPPVTDLGGSASADAAEPAGGPAAAEPAGDLAPAAPPEVPRTDFVSNEEGKRDGGSALTSLETPERDVAKKDKGSVAKVVREPLFENWPDPQVALVLTGSQYGYLEPCGCAGLENMTGGLTRRATLLDQLRARKWTVVPIDAGNQVRRFGRQPEVMFQVTLDGLRTMGYRAIAFGPDDLRLPAPELVGMMQADDPFVSANAVVLDPSFTSPFLIIEAGGRKIGVTSVLGPRNQKKVNSDEVILRDAEAALKDIWPKMKEQACDLYVLVAQASIDESIALARKFPQFSIVVTTGGEGEPARMPDQVEGTNSHLIQVGTKGMYAGVIGLYDDSQTPWRYQRVPLDARFSDSEAMLRLLAAYQQQLADIGLEGLGVRPQDHPSGLTFVGSKACQECHKEAYRIWEEGQNGHAPGHAKAFATLKKPPKRSSIPRQHDPECISCHVVGWNPQKYFPYKSGFVSEEKTPHLKDVGCESCHGPGSAHVAAEDGSEKVDNAELDRRRVEVRLLLEDAEPFCVTCHDLDNSPHFVDEGVFEEYWKRIAH